MAVGFIFLFLLFIWGLALLKGDTETVKVAYTDVHRIADATVKIPVPIKKVIHTDDDVIIDMCEFEKFVVRGNGFKDAGIRSGYVVYTRDLGHIPYNALDGRYAIFHEGENYHSIGRIVKVVSTYNTKTTLLMVIMEKLRVNWLIFEKIWLSYKSKMETNHHGEPLMLVETINDDGKKEYDFRTREELYKIVIYRES